MTAQTLLEAAKRARDPAMKALHLRNYEIVAKSEGYVSSVELLPGAKRLLLWGERQVAWRDGER